MPIYEYQCNACGHQFEALQKFSDGPIQTCPICSKEEVTKLISAAGFQLKGSGWYMTDYKDKGKTASNAAKPEDKSEKKETDAPKDTQPASTDSNNSSNNSAAG